MGDLKSETLSFEDKSVTLVSVKNGEAAIGVCSAGYTGMGGTGAVSKVFFIGGEAIMNIACPNHNHKQSSKLMCFSPGYKGYDQKIYNVLNVCFSRLVAGEPAFAALKDLLNLLQDGVYTLYVSDYYPTDGAGNFFWGAYNVSHEVHGTADRNRVIGNSVYKPCFLIPSQPLDYYTSKMKIQADERVKGRDIQGIAYHISGFHSILLKGHHGAVACAEADIPFRCLVIEKVCEPYTDPVVLPDPVPVPAPTAEEEAAAESDEAQVQQQAQVPQTAAQPTTPPVFVPEGITGFRSASLKLPIETIPKEMLKLILEGRSEYKPRQFNALLAKMNAPRRKAVSNNVLPLTVLEKAEKMPDVEMLESAFAISSISDEQLNCLLAGDVECNGEVIVSPNFYQSIVTACNYLQFTDPKRFVDFTIAIMDNPELSATHEYVSSRALCFGSNKKLFRFFSDALASGDAKYDKILPAANKFASRYKEK